LPTPGNTPPDIFSLTQSLPTGSYIVGFLSQPGGSFVATANSGALFATGTPAFPAPWWAQVCPTFYWRAVAFSAGGGGAKPPKHRCLET
jgi:hypothetical protein